MNTPPRPEQTASGPRRIVVSGAAHIDRTGWLSEPSALGCSNPGRFDERPGGTALNIARVVAELGAAVELISQVGDDAAAAWLRQEMISHGIKAHLTRAGGDNGNSDVGGHRSAKTGTYTSIIEPDGTLLVALADMTIYEDFAASSARALVADLTQEDWLCVDTNLPPEQIAQVLAASDARKVGVSVSRAKAPRLLTFASQLDLIFTNRVEACSLCGIEPHQNVAINEIANNLRQHFSASVVISDGSKQVTLVERDIVTSIQVPPIQQVVDVTGAGDALVGASLFALTQGANLVNAVRYGIEAAQATIQVQGAIAPALAKRIGPFHNSHRPDGPDRKDPK